MVHPSGNVDRHEKRTADCSVREWALTDEAQNYSLFTIGLLHTQPDKIYRTTPVMINLHNQVYRCDDAKDSLRKWLEHVEVGRWLETWRCVKPRHWFVSYGPSGSGLQ